MHVGKGKQCYLNAKPTKKKAKKKPKKAKQNCITSMNLMHQIHDLTPRIIAPQLTRGTYDSLRNSIYSYSIRRYSQAGLEAVTLSQCKMI